MMSHFEGNFAVESGVATYVSYSEGVISGCSFKNNGAYTAHIFLFLMINTPITI